MKLKLETSQFEKGKINYHNNLEIKDYNCLKTKKEITLRPKYSPSIESNKAWILKERILEEKLNFNLKVISLNWN